MYDRSKYNQIIQYHLDGLNYNEIAQITEIDRHDISNLVRFGMELGNFKITEKRKENYKNNRIKHKELMKRYYVSNKFKISEYSKNKHVSLKNDVLSHYSPALSCSSCGNTDIRVLELHHINNDGKEDRKRFGDGSKFYRSLKKRGYPTGYQVLCSNCNHDKEFERRGHGTSQTSICRHKLKLEVMTRYSKGIPKCHNCGDEDLQHLTIDHVHGGGGKHIREIGGGVDLYRWLRKNNYPSGFQVLCWNCQRIKRAENSECSGPKPSVIEYPLGIQGRMINGKPTKSQIRGVYKKGNKWEAYLLINGKNKYVGRFETKELAVQGIEKASDPNYIKSFKWTVDGKLCSSQYRGVSKHGNGWCAYINMNGKRINLGTFGTEEEAVCVYDSKAREHGRETNFK